MQNQHTGKKILVGSTLVAGAFLGGIGVIFNEMAQPLPDKLERLDQRSYVERDADLKDGECYYVAFDRAKEVYFRDWENGPFLAAVTLMALSEGRSHHMGLIPHFKIASCDILREDIKLTKQEAIDLEQAARREIKESPRADSLVQKLGESKGNLIVRVRDVPRP